MVDSTVSQKIECAIAAFAAFSVRSRESENQDKKTNMKHLNVVSCIAAALMRVAVFAQTNSTEQVFRYDQTLPVLGTPEIRAALPPGETRYRPVSYQADKGGWVIIADSFQDYRAARKTGLATRPAEASPSASGSGAEPQNPDFANSPASFPPNGNSWNTISGRRILKETATQPAPPQTPPYWLEDDPVIYFKAGDEARVHAAARLLCSEHLPTTQANINRLLGYTSTPPAPGAAGSANPGGSASTAAAATVPSAGPDTSQGGNPAVGGPVRSVTTPLPMPAQAPGRRLPSPKATSNR